MISLVRRWASHLIREHARAFIKDVPRELLNFSFSSWSLQLERIDLQEQALEHLGVLLPLQVKEAWLEDVVISVRWGSAGSISIQARRCVIKTAVRPYQDWIETWRTAPDLAGRDAAKTYKVAALRAHEEEVLGLARRQLGLEAPGRGTAVFMPDLDFALGTGCQATDCLQIEIDDKQADPRVPLTIALEGRLRFGLCLRQIVSPKYQAWRLDLSFFDVRLACAVGEELPDAVLGPCELLAVELEFAKHGKVPPEDVPDWPQRRLETPPALEERPRPALMLPTVHLAICSERPCPVRASLDQLAALTKHGLSWGRWFALKEALLVDMDEEVLPLAFSDAGAARYRQSWLRRLPLLLDAEAKRRPESEAGDEGEQAAGDTEDAEEFLLTSLDPKLVEFESTCLLREVLRERRIALLQSSADVDESVMPPMPARPMSQCSCSAGPPPFEAVFQDPTARHAFLLNVDLASSTVELYENSHQFLLVSPAPESETSRVKVQLGLDCHPDLPPTSLAVELQDCQLLTGKQHQLPAPLLLAAGPLFLCMDLAEHTDAALGKAFSPRFHVAAGGYLQCCLTHAALQDLLELIAQLQIELQESTAEDGGMADESDSDASSSTSDSTQDAAQSQSDVVRNISLQQIVAIIKRAEQMSLDKPSVQSCHQDLQIKALGAPVTVFLPVLDGRRQHEVRSDEERPGAKLPLRGVLALQLHVDCHPERSRHDDAVERSFSSSYEWTEGHDVISHVLLCVEDIAMWIVRDERAKELIELSLTAMGQLAAYRSSPLLLECGNIRCDCEFGARPSFAVHLDPISVYGGASEAEILALIASTFQSHPDHGQPARDSRSEKIPSPCEEAQTSPIASIEITASGISVCLLRARLGGREGRAEEVVAELDVGCQQLSLTLAESMQHVRYQLQRLRLSDARREVHLIEWVGERGGREGISAQLTKADDNLEAKLRLGDLRVFADWPLLGSLAMCLTLVQQATAAPSSVDAPPKLQEATGLPSRRPSTQEDSFTCQDLTIQGGFRKLQLFLPSDPEGQHGHEGLLLCCALHAFGSPSLRRSEGPGTRERWQCRAKVCELALSAAALSTSLDHQRTLSHLLHPMRVQITFVYEAFPESRKAERPTDHFGLLVQLEPIVVTVLPSHLRSAMHIRDQAEYVASRVAEADESQSTAAQPSSTPHRRATSPWMGRLRVSMPVLRLSAAASPDDGEDSCILLVEDFCLAGVAASGLLAEAAMCCQPSTTAEQAAAAAAAAMASTAAACATQSLAASAKAAASAAAASAAAADVEESPAASLRLKLDARVGSIYIDVTPATNAEDQELPLLEPVQLELQVPACEVDPTRRYVGAAVHKQGSVAQLREVWQGQLLQSALRPRLRVSWINIHASEQVAIILTRLRSCVDELGTEGGRRRSVRRSLNPQPVEPAREVGRGHKPVVRNRLGTDALLTVPDSRPVNYVIAHLLDGDTVALDEAKRRAGMVLAKMSRIARLHRRTFILPPNRTLVSNASGERAYNPLLSSVPTLARAEDFMVGAGTFAVGAAAGAVEVAAGAIQGAAGAMKETVKRSNNVLKEFHKAVTADEADDDDDVLPVTHSRTAHEGRERAALRKMGPQDLGLALLPGWPTADMRHFSSLKSRSAICVAVELPLIPPTARRLSRDRGSLESQEMRKELLRIPKERRLRAMDSLLSDDMDESMTEMASDSDPQRSRSSFSEHSASLGARAGGFVSESAQKQLQQLNKSATLFVEETQHLASRTVGKLGQVADIAGKAMSNLKNVVQTGKFRQSHRRETSCRILVRKATPLRKDSEARSELEISSTLFVENRSSIPLVVLPLAEGDMDSSSGTDEVPTISGCLLKSCGWMVLTPEAEPRPLPLLWSVSHRVLRSLRAAETAALAAMTDLGAGQNLAALVAHDNVADAFDEQMDLLQRVEDAACRTATRVFSESDKCKPLRVWCCPLSAVQEDGLDLLDAAEHEVQEFGSQRVWDKFKDLFDEGRMQPLLGLEPWRVVVGAKKLGNKNEMRGRCLENSLAGLCSTIYGAGLTRPRTPTDAVFYVIAVEPLIFVCNRLCCNLRLTFDEEELRTAADCDVLPGEDKAVAAVDHVSMELRLPSTTSVEGISGDAGYEAYILDPPLQLEGSAITPSSKRTSIHHSKKQVLHFLGPAGRQLEVQLEKQEGLTLERTWQHEVHLRNWAGHTYHITLFVSHWLVNRSGCTLLIPRPSTLPAILRPSMQLHSRSASSGLEDPQMFVCGHSLRPLSQHVIQEGTFDVGIADAAESEEAENTSYPPVARRSVFRGREPRQLRRTAVISAERPSKVSVLPLLHSGNRAFCLGYFVRQAPFPFYRTMLVEVTRRYTFVNHMQRTIWVYDGTKTLELPNGEPKAYEPSNPGPAQSFVFDISGTNDASFSAGFRLTQLMDFEEGSGIVLRSGKIQLMYKVVEDEVSNVVSSPVASGSGEMRQGVRQWTIAMVEALEDAGALLIRFSDPTKPQFRMVNRTSHTLVFHQDCVEAPRFKLQPEASLPFAWFSPCVASKAGKSPETEAKTAHPLLYIGTAAAEEEEENFATRGALQRYDIAQVREHENLVTGSGRRRAARKSGQAAERYKVRTAVHHGSLEVHVHPWLRVSNDTDWKICVRVRCKSLSEDSQIVEPGDFVDLWLRSPSGLMLDTYFQMRREAPGQVFAWSQPLTLSESMNGYRGFLRQRCEGRTDTVEVAAARDEVSGFLRLRLSCCNQEPFLIDNQSTHKCTLAPQNASGWTMNLKPEDGPYPFLSHLWGGDTVVLLTTVTGRGRHEQQETFEFDLAKAFVHTFGPLRVEVGQAKQNVKLVVIRDGKPAMRRTSRRSKRDSGVLQTLKRRMSTVLHSAEPRPRESVAERVEMGVRKVVSLATGHASASLSPGNDSRSLSFTNFQEVNHPETNRFFSIHQRSNASFEGGKQPNRWGSWMQITHTLTSMSAYRRPNSNNRVGVVGNRWRVRPPCCGGGKVERRRKHKTVRGRGARSVEVSDEHVVDLEWSLDLVLEGVGIAMLDIRLDSGESHEVGYGSLRALKVKVLQHAAKTDVEGRAGALSAEMQLSSAQLDVGHGQRKMQGKDFHAIIRPFSGPLQILSDETGEPPPLINFEALLKFVNENHDGEQEGISKCREGSTHYEVRKLELRAQPVGLQVETALLAEVVVWVLELCNALKTGKLRAETIVEQMAQVLEAEECESTAFRDDTALVDLCFCEPRCVRDPTAEHFRDLTPLMIRELTLRRICCVLSLSFTGTGSWNAEMKEQLQALEMLLRLTLPLDVHQARLMLGKIHFGWRGPAVRDLSVRERFLASGTEELSATLVHELSRTVLQQVPKLFASQLLLGNPLQLGEELLRAMELAAHGCTRFQPQAVAAAFLLAVAALTASVRGMFLIMAKEACRLSTGQVPDKLLREPSRAREAVGQAFYYGLPWHCMVLGRRIRNRWRKSRKVKRRYRWIRGSEGYRSLLQALMWSLLAPISALLVTVAKLMQALELLIRRSARWASPRHVTAIGPPLPSRTGSQQFVVGCPCQFSRAASPALMALRPETLAQVSCSEWELRVLPRKNHAGTLAFQEEQDSRRKAGGFSVHDDIMHLQEIMDPDSEDAPWGWLLLLHDTAELVLLQSRQIVGIRVELLDLPEETCRIPGPFAKVDLSDELVLQCYQKKPDAKPIELQLPCLEAGLAAFQLACQNVS